jgi:hypothetical protein
MDCKVSVTTTQLCFSRKQHRHHVNKYARLCSDNPFLGILKFDFHIILTCRFQWFMEGVCNGGCSFIHHALTW